MTASVPSAIDHSSRDNPPEAVSPETVVTTLAHPDVRRRVRDALTTPQPTGAALCREVLAAVATAAAVRAGHPARLDDHAEAVR